ncbi:MAG TPA: GTP 3',8-cyclase MoaA [Propionibacteriaceae bacterium]|nr:GTP 3',8-cyclase MoaA [Propionibacteriaceae bacterium]HQE30992.1 GTP 3',8-cyclase MoaA [Propionibacteriaceae bacterium]
MGPALDSFGRAATDLRVSLTDRCNLRCSYCMPAEGLAWLPNDDLLTNDELVRLLRLGTSRLGITTVRLTGGEPMLRPDLETLVEQVAALEPRPVVALTTNGIGLARRAEKLKAAGLDRINVSLDTLQPDRFATLTRRHRLDDVLAGIRAARDAGLVPVKVNSVLMRGINDDEAAGLVTWAGQEGVELRFIEQMPLDAQHGWKREEMVTAAEIHAALAPHVTLVPIPGRGSAPAERFQIKGTDQTVGIIASVTLPFCGACDRVRLTADGQLRSCLFSLKESDLRTAMRAGATDDDLEAMWRACLAAKLPGHGINDPSFLQPRRPMSAIGG